MKGDKKDNEERFIQMQESIDKRMENFILKVKGSHKDENCSIKTSSKSSKEKGATLKPPTDQEKK